MMRHQSLFLNTTIATVLGIKIIIAAKGLLTAANGLLECGGDEGGCGWVEANHILASYKTTYIPGSKTSIRCH